MSWGPNLYEWTRVLARAVPPTPTPPPSFLPKSVEPTLAPSSPVPELLPAAARAGTPWWLTVLVGLITLSGVVVSAWLARRTGSEATINTAVSNLNAAAQRVDDRLAATELDKWRRREETMRLLRWASEQAVQSDWKLARVGLGTLRALWSSELLQPEDHPFVEVVLKAVTASAREDIVEAQMGDEEIVVIVEDQ